MSILNTYQNAEETRSGDHHQERRFHALYVAPTRALCQEVADKLRASFARGNLKISVQCSSAENYSHRATTNILVCTPEKIEIMSHKWEMMKHYFSRLKLCILDEIHTIGDGIRGACLEAIVTRLKIISHIVNSKTRLCAASATIQNMDVLGRWLGVPENGGIHNFGEEYRPIPLDLNVVGFSSSSNDWLFHFKQLDQHVSSLIAQYGDGKPAIVFCASKEGSQKLAVRIADEIQCLDDAHETFMMQADKSALTSMTAQISDKTLSGIVHGASVAWHHAGMETSDRRLIETMFRSRPVRIVCCTTTLALGVNMPARLVIVRCSKVYRGAGKGIVDIDRSSLIQMVGRAGRYGMDTAGVAIVMTRQGEEMRIQDMVSGKVRV